MFSIKRVFAILIFSFFFFSCSKEDNPVDNQPPQGYQYTIPQQTDDGWETASLAAEGMTLAPLVDMVNFIDTTKDHQIHNILIFKNKKLVFEKYFDARSYSSSPPSLGANIISYNMNMTHWLASGSKSVTSVLFGIAVDKGLISSNMDKKISTHFSQYSSILTGDKENITVEHLLTMTSGLDWDENTYPYGDSRNDVTQLFQNADPIRFVLSKNMHGTPGTVFHYNSGVTNVLAEMIHQYSDLTLLQFAENNLFQSLGITQYEWQKIRGNYYFASGGLSLRPRDMAKIGFLFLNEGKWKGVQVLSQEWIQSSIQNFINPNWDFANGYGYQWWLNSVQSGNTTINYILSSGLGEQLMFIVPALDVILVFNCGYLNVPVVISPYQLINTYIAESIFGG